MDVSLLDRPQQTTVSLFTYFWIMWQNRISHGNIKLRASISLHWFCFWACVPPSVLQLLSTSVFKNGGYRWLYNWKLTSQSTYWSTSSREFGCLMQIVPLLIVPFAGIVQSCRYLATGPPDLFDVSVRKRPTPFIFVIFPLPPSLNGPTLHAGLSFGLLKAHRRSALYPDSSSRLLCPHPPTYTVLASDTSPFFILEWSTNSVIRIEW